VIAPDRRPGPGRRSGSNIWRLSRVASFPGVLARALGTLAWRDSPVPRRVKDFIDISEYTSLDDLIRYLETIRDNLPSEHDAELQIRGDEVFGRRLTITYFREQTPEEFELESKYSAGKDEEIDRLTRELDDVPYKPDKAANN
jgi:hypothetical protein